MKTLGKYTKTFGTKMRWFRLRIMFLWGLLFRQSTAQNSSGRVQQKIRRDTVEKLSEKLALVLFKDHAAVRRQSFGNCIKPFQ